MGLLRSPSYDKLMEVISLVILVSLGGWLGYGIGLASTNPGSLLGQFDFLLPETLPLCLWNSVLTLSYPLQCLVTNILLLGHPGMVCGAGGQAQANLPVQWLLSSRKHALYCEKYYFQCQSFWPFWVLQSKFLLPLWGSEKPLKKREAQHPLVLEAGEMEQWRVIVTYVAHRWMNCIRCHIPVCIGLQSSKIFLKENGYNRKTQTRNFLSA